MMIKFAESEEEKQELKRECAARSEVRFEIQKVALGLVDTKNPLIELYAHDRVVDTLKIDTEGASSAYTNTACCYYGSSCCLSVMFPSILFESAALAATLAGHELTLRERSLQLKIHSYPDYMQTAWPLRPGTDKAPDDDNTETRGCCDCCSWFCPSICGELEYTPEYLEVIPLQEVRSVHVEQVCIHPRICLYTTCIYMHVEQVHRRIRCLDVDRHMLESIKSIASLEYV